jgi:hypothetical protein
MTTTKLALTIISLCAAIACAGPMKSSARSPTNAEIDAAESGVPASVDYANRPVDKHNPTAAEIDTAEQGNPDYVGNKDTAAIAPNANWKADWENDDRGTPAEQSAQPDKR